MRTHRLRDLKHTQLKRILIIKPSSFGDVIHALPVLNGLRHTYPNAHIAWLVSTSCAGLLQDHHALDEIIPFDRKRFGKLGRDWAVTREFIAFVKQLHRRRFDLVVDLQGLFRSGFLALASGARTRIGFANARELGWIFYSDRVAVPHRDMHAVDRNYLFGRPLGFAHQPLRFELPVTEQDRAEARTLLQQEGVNGVGYCLIAPGTRWETKMWSAEGFAQVADQLRERFALTPVLIGMPDERDIAERVVGIAEGEIVNLAGRTNLGVLKALVEGATLAVMHDSGPMHLATALNTPFVAIYGPTSPQRTGPYARPDAVVRLDLPCSPCYLRRVSQCPHAHRCMRELSPDSVIAMAGRLIRAGRDAR